MNSSDHPMRNRPDALTAHLGECDACRADEPSLRRLRTILASSAVDLDPSLLSRRALPRLRHELQRVASARSWRQIVMAVLLALVPLPAVLAYDAYLLHAIHGLVSSVLPTAFATYLVGSYAAFLLLLFATTYAAIPVLLGRSEPMRRPA
jgi:anti-sigma factor RsiW